jgi:hypothetical protein
MSESPVKKPRKPNPKYGECKHPVSFHARDVKSHRRPCNAFGCQCKKFVKEKADA